jgi:hypothetical protein
MTKATLALGRPGRAVVPQLAQGLAGMAALWVESLSRLDGRLLRRQSQESQTAEDLLERASAIEATQPSFAADLRAVALRSQGVEHF